MKERITFYSTSGNRCIGILTLPEKNSPVLICLHGAKSSKESTTYVTLSNALAEKNIGCFRIDLYGHGESGGSFENLTTSELVDEALCAIDLLKNRGLTRIGLLGGSMGGIAATIAASTVPDLKALVLIAPVSDWFGVHAFAGLTTEKLTLWKKEGSFPLVLGGETVKMNYSFISDAKQLSVYESAKTIKAPTLLIHGDADQSVPIEQSKKLKNNIKNCRFELLKGAPHHISKTEHFEKVIAMITSFIEEKFG